MKSSKHSIGTLSILDNEIFELHPSERYTFEGVCLTNLHVIMPYPDFYPVVYYFGSNAEEKTNACIERAPSIKFYVMRDKDLIQSGLTLDERCTLLNYVMNSMSLEHLPSLIGASVEKMRRVITELDKLGW